MPTRRSFLVMGSSLAAGATAVALAPPLVSPEATLVRFLRAKAAPLAFPEEDIRLFARAALAHWRLGKVERKAVLFLMENPLLLRLAPRRIRLAQDRQERWILTKFLLSTDALDGRPEGEVRSYSNFADPYVLGCANPLARFEDEGVRPDEDEMASLRG